MMKRSNRRRRGRARYSPRIGRLNLSFINGLFQTRNGRGQHSVRRGQKRRHRFRVVNRRRFIAAQAVLAVVALGALGLSASVIVRSIKTSRLNRSLVAMHTVDGESPTIQVAAPPISGQFETASTAGGSMDEMQLSYMVMPDGSEIKTEAPKPVTATSGVYHNTTGDILPDMMKLLSQNPDTVGWLHIKGIVNLPVVYRDNTFYLTHDFSGDNNDSGALFLDEGHPVTAATQNLLIYGHSMYDGSMFGLLTHYRRLSSLKQHPLIEFSTLWEKETYAIFAVLKVSSLTGDADYFNYFTHPTFASDAAFTEYIGQVQSRSLFDIPVSVEPTDALLTLSTCLDEDRLVIFARRIRPDETKDELVSAIEATA